MVQASLEADPHAAAGALPPVLGEPGLARPASSDEVQAWQRLDLLQGPGERRAALLALVITPGSVREQQAWADECKDVPKAALAQELIQCLSLLARPAALERVLHDCRNAPREERVELLRSTRRVMSADGLVGPLDRLRWLYMRQCLSAGEPGVGAAAPRGAPAALDASEPGPPQTTRADTHALPESLKQPTSRLTSYLARMVPQADAQSKVGTLGVAWHRAVLTQLWGDDVPPCQLPDGDQLVLALAEVQELSWMQRPLLARTWTDAAFALARRRPAQRPAPPVYSPTSQTLPMQLGDNEPMGDAAASSRAAADRPVPPATGAAGGAPQSASGSASASPCTSAPASEALPAGLPEADALYALRLACRMIDTPLPPELARVFVEHPLTVAAPA
ncbi:MAG: hypothetical protein RIQ60_1202 [Pseudomonadota bacterium]|jgi:hypothetical protein